jgi:hypothetical protein
MNIYEKLSAITNEISAVAKNLNVGYGKSQYKAVGEADVLAAVKPTEAKYKVYSYPVSRRVIESNVLTSLDKDGNEKRQLFMRLEVVYRFVNMENPEEYIDITTYGDGVDPGDKAPGKAMTYADKYALLKAYKIITGDDPDQKASETLKAVERKETVSNQLITDVQAVALESVLTAGNVNIPKLLEMYKVKTLRDLTQRQHAEIIARLKRSEGNT